MTDLSSMTYLTSKVVPLTFVVIGASIAGLTSAYILRISGHDVVVVEKSSGPMTVSRLTVRKPSSLT